MEKMLRKIARKVILFGVWSIGSGCLASLTGCLGFIRGGAIGLIVIIMASVGMRLINEWIDWP